MRILYLYVLSHESQVEMFVTYTPPFCEKCLSSTWKDIIQIEPTIPIANTTIDENFKSPLNIIWSNNLSKLLHVPYHTATNRITTKH